MTHPSKTLIEHHIQSLNKVKYLGPFGIPSPKFQVLSQTFIAGKHPSRVNCCKGESFYPKTTMKEKPDDIAASKAEIDERTEIELILDNLAVGHYDGDPTDMTPFLDILESGVFDESEEWDETEELPELSEEAKIEARDFLSEFEDSPDYLRSLPENMRLEKIRSDMEPVAIDEQYAIIPKDSFVWEFVRSVNPNFVKPWSRRGLKELKTCVEKAIRETMWREYRLQTILSEMSPEEKEEFIRDSVPDEVYDERLSNAKKEFRLIDCLLEIKPLFKTFFPREGMTVSMSQSPYKDKDCPEFYYFLVHDGVESIRDFYDGAYTFPTSWHGINLKILELLNLLQDEGLFSAKLSTLRDGNRTLKFSDVEKELLAKILLSYVEKEFANMPYVVGKHLDRLKATLEEYVKEDLINLNLKKIELGNFFNHLNQAIPWRPGSTKTARMVFIYRIAQVMGIYPPDSKDFKRWQTWEQNRYMMLKISGAIQEHSQYEKIIDEPENSQDED